MTSITLSTPVTRSARTLQLEGMFDLGPTSESVVRLESFPVERLDERPWNIGLIVGPSGSGKTQTARHAFADAWPEPFNWANDRAVVDEMPTDIGVKEIVEVLSSVGFSSPPAWLRPFKVLSNGEKFRVEVARALLEQRDMVVIDEFTSVVDRTVAKVASHAVQKLVRRRQQKLVAVTCHYDVHDWLQPDWVYEPVTASFTWRSVQRRPGVEVEFVRGSSADWPLFRSHHYLSENFVKSSRVVLALIGGQPVAFCAVFAQPHAVLKNAWRVHRIVTLPDFQGIGVGNVLLQRVCGGLTTFGKSVRIITSHPGLMASLNRSDKWDFYRQPTRNPKPGIRSGIQTPRNTATNRLVGGFRYVGPEYPDMRPLLAGGALT